MYVIECNIVEQATYKILEHKSDFVMDSTLVGRFENTCSLVYHLLEKVCSKHH